MLVGAEPLVSVPDQGLDFEQTVAFIERSILEQALRKSLVAEWVLAVVLADLKELPRWIAAQREHRWREGSVELGNLDGATVLIAGHGAIGAAVEARLEPFGRR